MLYKFTHCVRCILANTKPDQLLWGDRGIGTAISCIECSQMPSLNEKVVENPSKAPSLHAAVLRAAVLRIAVVRSEIVRSDHILYV